MEFAIYAQGVGNHFGAPVKVAEVMTAKTMTLSPAQKLSEVISMIANHSFRHALVIDAEQKLCGVISDRDVLRAMARTQDWDAKEVSEIMTREPITATPDMPISVAIKSMLGARINCLPVVGPDARACGILTSTDLLQAYEKIQTCLEKNTL